MIKEWIEKFKKEIGFKIKIERMRQKISLWKSWQKWLIAVFFLYWFCRTG